MKIVILDGYTENPGDLSWAPLEALGELTVYDRTPADKIIERIGDAEIVFTNKTPINAEAIAAGKNIKFIGVLATGYNVIDIAAAKERGIPVCNVPGYSTPSVAQHVFALLLEITNHVGAHSDSVHAGKWAANPDFCYWDYPMIELAGKTLGIIGYGSIGKAVAKIAVAFGMNVLANARHVDPSQETENIRYATREEVFAKSDIISFHCPLFPETQGMVNKDSIATMKDGVIIINTARGPIVVDEDVVAAVQSGKIAAYAADVVSAEPIKPENPLQGKENIVLTPHIAWAPKESRQRLMDITVSNLRAFLNGAPQNVVNP
jgi:glycerate dehydrogenase